MFDEAGFVYSSGRDHPKLSICLGVWLWLFFKVFFVLKCIKIIFFYF